MRSFRLEARRTEESDCRLVLPRVKYGGFGLLSAYTKKLETGEVVLTFRFNENGIIFDLERGSWQAFRNLLHRASKHPEVRRLWDDAVLRYGEF